MVCPSLKIVNFKSKAAITIEETSTTERKKTKPLQPPRLS